MNVEEKDTKEFMNTPVSSVEGLTHVKQKSMSDLIKERYLGPMVLKNSKNPGVAASSQSFMKRNILLTTSNCSNRSSTCSIKSSFLNKNNGNGRMAGVGYSIGMKPSF
jgi:hypothetical protein